jgi:hypothetical protein
MNKRGASSPFNPSTSFAGLYPPVKPVRPEKRIAYYFPTALTNLSITITSLLRAFSYNTAKLMGHGMQITARVVANRSRC